MPPQPRDTADNGAMSVRRPVLLSVPAALAAVLLLAGCGPEGTASPEPTASGSPRPTASATPTAGPAPSAQPTAAPEAQPEVGEPVTVGCDQLVTAQEMYDYNPNFGLDATFTPDAGSVAGQALAAGGVVCRWTNQTSGETIDVSVAQPVARELASRKDELAATSTPAAFGPDGYFDASDITGVAQAFVGPFWVTATSTVFFQAEDAAPIMSAVIAAVE